MERDPWATITALADYGYKYIETFEGSKGMFWGKSPQDFAKFIADQGMKAIAGHCDVFTDTVLKASQAAEAGLLYMVCPWLGAQPTIAEYEKAAERFNQIGELCRRSGVQFAYHNHDYTFQQMEDIVPQEVLMSATDPSLVVFEMDMYWVEIAGNDPLVWLTQHKGRWPLVHIKDKMDKNPADDKFISTVLGRGTIDYHYIVPQLAELGVEFVLVEQERFDGVGTLEACKLNAEYMRTI